MPSEANISNTPFTLAMALSGGSNGQTNPNSGNSEFFFNTVDNSGSLNPQGFTVFGKVLSASQTAFSNLATPMIAAGTNETLQGGTTEIPLYNGYPANSSSFPGDTVANNYALITNVQVTTPSAATLTYSASVSGANPNLVSVSFGSDLNGFDKNLLVLNYTPGQTGTATITVTATNQNGVSVTTTFTVTVS